jgi:hypothetical protein
MIRIMAWSSLAALRMLVHRRDGGCSSDAPKRRLILDFGVL